MQISRIVAVLLVLMLISGSKTAWSSESDIPNAGHRVIKADAALKAVMAHRYGPYDDTTDTWTAKLFDDFAKKPHLATMHVCASKTLAKMNPPERLVAICGTGTDAHGAGGLADFYLLKLKPDRVAQLATSLTGLGNGFNGDPGLGHILIK